MVDWTAHPLSVPYPRHEEKKTPLSERLRDQLTLGQVQNFRKRIEEGPVSFPILPYDDPIDQLSEENEVNEDS